jgi:N utilization substance protein A
MKRHKDESDTNAAGQAGDLQQLPDEPTADSESVQELLEEGNAFEADAVAGVENAEDPDVSEVVTREVPEDDVPPEYLDDGAA